MFNYHIQNEVNCLKNLTSKYVYTLFYFILINMRYEILLYLVFYNKNGFDNQIYQISLLIYEKRKERNKLFRKFNIKICLYIILLYFNKYEIWNIIILSFL